MTALAATALRPRPGVTFPVALAVWEARDRASDGTTLWWLRLIADDARAVIFRVSAMRGERAVHTLLEQAARAGFDITEARHVYLERPQP